MKKIYSFIALFLVLFVFNTLYSQGYFVAEAGNYFSSDNFKTNVQIDFTKYEGRYVAASETYESNYEYIIISEGNVLMITMISGATDDGGENWMMDTLIFRNVTVIDGKFTLTDLPSNLGNQNFRFVKASYMLEGKNRKSGGLIMEEYLMFAQKE
jgi:hypothetical protein